MYYFKYKERCQRGRMGLTRNQLFRQRNRGFESHPLRTNKHSPEPV